MEISSDSNSDSVVRPHFTGQAEEGELSDLDQDISVTNTDQAASEEKNYRETMCGICSYMGLSHILDMDSNTSSSEDNPFAYTQTTTGLQRDQFVKPAKSQSGMGSTPTRIDRPDEFPSGIVTRLS